MKKLIFIVLFLMRFAAIAQDSKTVALSYGIAFGKVGNLSNEVSGKSLATYGVNYRSEIKKDFFFETGLQLMRYSFSSLDATHMPATFGITRMLVNKSVNAISIPFKLRYETGLIFFNGGILIGMSRNVGLSGIGAGLGAGLQLQPIKNLSVFINPQANVHSLLNFSDTDYLKETNLTFGLAYRIK